MHSAWLAGKGMKSHKQVRNKQGGRVHVVAFRAYVDSYASCMTNSKTLINWR